jgi:hypothetical protein
MDLLAVVAILESPLRLKGETRITKRYPWPFAGKL